MLALTGAGIWDHGSHAYFLSVLHIYVLSLAINSVPSITFIERHGHEVGGESHIRICLGWCVIHRTIYIEEIAINSVRARRSDGAQSMNASCHPNKIGSRQAWPETKQAGEGRPVGHAARTANFNLQAFSPFCHSAQRLPGLFASPLISGLQLANHGELSLSNTTQEQPQKTRRPLAQSQIMQKKNIIWIMSFSCVHQRSTRCAELR